MKFTMQALYAVDGKGGVRVDHIQLSDLRCAQESRDVAVRGGQRAQPVGKRGYDEPIDVAGVAEAMNGTGRNEDGAGCTQVAYPIGLGNFTFTRAEPEYLEERIVPVLQYLPIVQVRALGNGLAVNPEIARFS